MTKEELLEKLQSAGLPNNATGAKGASAVMAGQINDGENFVFATVAVDDAGKTGILAVTQTRIIFASKILFDKTFWELPINRVNSVGVKTSLLGAVAVETGNSVFGFGNMSNANAQEFSKAVNHAMATPSNSSGSTNNLEQLKQLKELLDMGAITQDEFDKKKADLL